MSKNKTYQKTATLLIDKNKKYPPDEALTLIKQSAAPRFDATVELHIRLGIDAKKGDQQVRGTIELPHGTGKSNVVAAFVETGKEEEARKAGADIVGGEELMEQIKQSGKCNFTEAVATPAMMPKLARIAKILGPKGLMPSPKNETVGTHITELITAIKRGKVSYKNDDTANLHLSIGKVSFDQAHLLDNLTAALTAIKKNKPPAVKGIFFKKVYLATTMGPSIQLEYAG